jgi:hypothetical protein
MLSQMLRAQRRSEVGIALADKTHEMVTGGVIDAPRARPAPPLAHERLCSFFAPSSGQSLELAHRQPQPLGSVSLQQPGLADCTLLVPTEN